MRDNLRDALRLAQQGYKVIPLHTATEGACDCGRTPCATPGKHPWLRDWIREASDQLNSVLAWWKERAAANIGVACERSGLLVIDVDPRHGGDTTIEEWVAEHGALPEGPRVVTGGGGLHLYFKHPGGRVPSRTVAPGIDCKADGGQVVAPPSVHASGMMYRWLEGYGPERALPDAPDWLLVICQSRAQVLSDGPRAVPEAIAEGARHQVLHSFGSALRAKGMGEYVIAAALLALNEERCAPPMPRGEVVELAHDVAQRYEPTEAFVIGPTKPEDTRRAIEPYTMAELEHMELPPPRWAVDGMLPAGLGLLGGPIKLGKSYLAFGLGLAIAEGDIVLGAQPVEDGQVLYIALEDSKSRMQRRGRQIHPEPGWPERMEVIDLSHKLPRIDEGGLSFLDAWLGDHPEARLVVIDTLQRFRSRKESKRGVYAQDVDEVEPLQEMALRHGVAVLCIHHFNKAPHDDWVDSLSGSAGIGGTADCIWGLFRPRGRAGQKDGRLRITGRDVEEQDYSVTLEGFRWTITQDREETDTVDAAAPRFQSLVTYLQQRPWEKYTIREVQDHFHLTYDAARMLLNEARDAGLVVKAGRGEFRLPDENRRNEGDTYHALRFASVESEPKEPSPNRSETKETEAPKETEGRTPPKPLPENLVGRACPTCGVAEPWVWTGHGWVCGVCRPALRLVGDDDEGDQLAEGRVGQEG